jgi:hypothetical protein
MLGGFGNCIDRDTASDEESSQESSKWPLHRSAMTAAQRLPTPSEGRQEHSFSTGGGCGIITESKILLQDFTGMT